MKRGFLGFGVVGILRQGCFFRGFKIIKFFCEN